MSQRKFNHLFDLSQLLTTSTDIVVTNFIQSILLLLTSHMHIQKPLCYISVINEHLM